MESKVANIPRPPLHLPALPKTPTCLAHCSCVFIMGSVAPSPVSLVNINWMGTTWELEMETAISETISCLPIRYFVFSSSCRKGLRTGIGAFTREYSANLLEPSVSSHRDLLLMELLFFSGFIREHLWGDLISECRRSKGHIFLTEQTVFYWETHIDPSSWTQLWPRSVIPISILLRHARKKGFPPSLLS